MPKEFAFEYAGTREAFLKNLEKHPSYTGLNGEKYYYFDDFIVKVTEDTIHFGVERSGHSGGYWFVPTITEGAEMLTFRGSIAYIGPEGERSKRQKIIDGVEMCLLFILVFPIILIVLLYRLAAWLVRKLIHKPKAKEKTKEEKLLDLMAAHLGCVHTATKE